MFLSFAYQICSMIAVNISTTNASDWIKWDVTFCYWIRPFTHCATKTSKADQLDSLYRAQHLSKKLLVDTTSAGDATSRFSDDTKNVAVK